MNIETAKSFGKEVAKIDKVLGAKNLYSEDFVRNYFHCKYGMKPDKVKAELVEAFNVGYDDEIDVPRIDPDTLPFGDEEICEV